MRFLFVTGGSPATVFVLTPLATALRNAGHEVLVAADESLMSVVAGNGLPAVNITSTPVHHYMWTDVDGGPATLPRGPRETMLFAGRAFGRMADAGLDALLELGRAWAPDLVVGGATSYAAGLAAVRLDVPYVRHAWDFVPTAGLDEGAAEFLEPHLRALGLDGLPTPSPFIDITPPALRDEDAPEAQLMRFVPGNRQRSLEPWMYTRPDTRRRILITAGTRGGHSRAENAAHMRTLNESLSALEAEVLIAAPDDVAESLRGEIGHARVGWIPLDVVAPTCDVIVNHGGGVTALTALNAGVPQLVAPREDYQVASAVAIAEFGACILLDPGQDTAEPVVEACQKLLADSAYRERSRILADQIAELPSPNAVAEILQRRAGG